MPLQDSYLNRSIVSMLVSCFLLYFTYDCYPICSWFFDSVDFFFSKIHKCNQIAVLIGWSTASFGYLYFSSYFGTRFQDNSIIKMKFLPKLLNGTHDKELWPIRTWVSMNTRTASDFDLMSSCVPWSSSSKFKSLSIKRRLKTG